MTVMDGYEMEMTVPFTVGRGVILQTLLFHPSTGWPVWSVALSLIQDCLYSGC